MNAPRLAEDGRANRLGRNVLVAVALLFLAVCLPVVVRGAPLADDFYNCLVPQRIGLGSTLAESFERLGVLRRAHVLEIVVTTEVCQHLPFGIAIAIPVILTLVVAVLLVGLVKDLGAPGPWPELAGAAWLLQPLGTESALWPAAMHVPLGLVLALAALRLHRAGHHRWGSVAVAAAALSVEQVVLALPLAVWLAAPPERRRRAVISTVVVIGMLAIAFVIWPGNDPRISATLGQRITELFADAAFLVKFPAVGVGIHSIPLAVVWAFPLSVFVLACGGLVGSWLGPALLAHPHRHNGAQARRTVLAALGLVAAVNIPVLLAVPHQGSPRLFGPTWIVIAAMVGLLGPLVPWRRLRSSGAIAGIVVAGALLSMTFSVWVRLETASFTESASRTIARAVPDEAVVAVCGISRTVVQPAPRGAFAIHEFLDEGTAQHSLYYYEKRSARFVLAGEVWSDRSCPGTDGVDRVMSFSDLLMRWRNQQS
jgi:uncharacterized membrane protein YqjE